MKKILILVISFFAFTNCFTQATTNGLVAYYPLNGNYDDYSGNGNNAIIEGATSLTSDRFGNTFSAYNFGGYYNSSALRVNNSSTIQFSNEMTISLWYSLNNYGGMDGYGNFANYGYQMLFSKDGDRGGFYAGLSGNVAQDSVSFNITNNNGNQNFNANALTKGLTSNLNKWIHMTYIVGNGRLKILRNGVIIKNQVLVNAPDFSNANLRNLYFGRFGFGGPWAPLGWYPLNGKLDEIRVYNRAITEAEAQQIYNAEAPLNDIITGLVTYLPFNNNLNDASGNNNNGIANGTLVYGAGAKNQGLFVDKQVGDYVRIPHSASMENITQQSISFWVKPTDFDLNCWNEREMIIGKGQDIITNSYGLSIIRNKITGSYCGDATSFTNYKFSYENGGQNIQTPFYQVDGNWIHVAGTYDGQIAKIFINGLKVGENNIGSVNITNTNPIFINYATWSINGIPGQTNGRYAGGIDEVRVYNRPLSENEVLEVFNNAGISVCPTCITGVTAASFSTNEHYCAAQILCSQTIINKAQTDPKVKIIRGDLAKISYLGLIGRTAVTNAQNYPVPFIDLQADKATDTTYFKFAKVLSYLEYADNKAPFDRNFLRFNPSDTITRAAVLKVLLETWNIDESTASGASPFNDVTAAHPYYSYIKKAHELGIVTGSGGLFRPDIGCSREDAFLMLKRLLTNASILKPSLTQINAGFFTPGQFRPDNLSVGAGTDRGNFNHYTKTSFAMDGVVPLIFAHSYNSYATELPNEIFPNYMGRGWTHSFNCYIVASPASTNTVSRRIVHYPDGKLHYYKEAPNGVDWIPESIGVFDTMVDGIGYIEITTPSKIVYRFESVSGQTNTKIKLVRTIKDRNNNTLTFTNENGVNGVPRVASVSDPAGRAFNFTYLVGQTYNYLSQVTLAGVGAFNGRNIQFNYSSTAWDGDGIKDLTSYKEYDKNGALKTTSYAYYTVEGSEHLLKTITLPKGNVIDNTYQQRKLKSSQTLNGATVVQQMNTNWTPTYSASAQSSTGSVSVTASGVTKTTNYTHNSNGLSQSINSTGTNPVNLSMDYGLNGDPTSVTNITQTHGGSSTGVRIKYGTAAPYNVEFVRTAKAVGDSITQSYTYNSFNDILTFINGRGNTTSFGYNPAGNLTTITHPLGQPTSMLRNTNGTISRVTTPAGIVTNFTYNTYGNLLTTSTPNGTSPAITTSATYDALSRVVSKTDARNQTVTYEYYSNDLLKKMNAPLSYYVSYDYDANDNNTTVTNAKGNATTNVYHPQTDQLLSRSFGSKTESFTYNEDGSLKTFTNGRSQVFTFTYDQSGRVTDDSYAAYNYNVDGTLNTITHTQGAKTYTLDYDYDILKRLNKTTCDGFAVQYRYDNNNNLDLLTYPDGKTVSYTYDNKDRLTSITDWAGRTTTYTYDDDGKILTYTLTNGSKTIYSYDAAGRPTGISHKKSTNVVICSSSFVLDQGGNHLEENIVEPYTTAPALSASTTNYTTDARNQTTAAGSNAYTFDGNGATTNQAGQALTWDTKDNLLTAYGKTFFYDGNETRRAKTGKRYVINELSNSVIAETNDAGTYLYYYVYGPTGLLYRQSVSGVIEYYHYDFRGSTIAMTNASQTLVRQYQYDAYGKILQQTPATATDDNPFRFVGRYGMQYEEPNLYFVRARYYDPTIGKFLSEDPKNNTNLFAYSDNNPIKYIDFNGKNKFTEDWLAGFNILYNNTTNKINKIEKYTVDFVTKSQEWYFEGMVSEYSKGKDMNKVSLFLYKLGWGWSDLWVNDKTRDVIISQTIGIAGGYIQAAAGLDAGSITVKVFGKSGKMIRYMDFRFKDSKQLLKFIDLAEEGKTLYEESEALGDDLLKYYEESLK